MLLRLNIQSLALVEIKFAAGFAKKGVKGRVIIV
jgi:hypothetical protein